MLFGYPINATAENWLHECLAQIIQQIHVELDHGACSTEWPAIVPAAHREKLSTRHGLRDRIIAYRDALSSLSAEERNQVATNLTQQNRIRDLCKGDIDCQTLSHLPALIQAPICELFDFAFGLLSKFGIRDRHYGLIYRGTRYHVCPFCGCEYFDAPGAPREDLDHYLPRSLYPFAGVNLRNLVPMGMRCNQRYKLNGDILRNSIGDRRRVFDPYSAGHIEIRLTNSVPFEGSEDQLPRWEIDFFPVAEECAAWDEIFHIRERVKRDVLDPSFNRWLGDFAAWFKRRIGVPTPDSHALLNAMLTYVEDLTLLGLNAREFLRAPVFKMLHVRCANGDDRLTALMIDLISAETPA